MLNPNTKTLVITEWVTTDPFHPEYLEILSVIMDGSFEDYNGKIFHSYRGELQGDFSAKDEEFLNQLRSKISISAKSGSDLADMVSTKDLWEIAILVRVYED